MRTKQTNCSVHNMISTIKTNNDETSPSNDKGSDNMTKNEVVLTNLNQGGKGHAPVPSTCNDAASGVIRPIPSNIVTHSVAAVLARDMSSDLSS